MKMSPSTIDRIAKRQLPAVRKAEIERLASLRAAVSGEKPTEKTESINSAFEKFIAEEVETTPSKYTKRYHALFTKEGTVKHDRRFKFNRKKENQYFKELEEDTDTALDKKASETGISKSILKQVFERGAAAWKSSHRPGTTPEQWGLARVNSFATGGKTRTTADADLWAKHQGKSESFLADAEALMEEVESFVAEATKDSSTAVKPFVSFKTRDYSTPVSKHIKHHLGVGVPFAHMEKDAVKNVDLDYDGDVDDQEKNPAVEFGGAEKQNMTKLIHKKMAGEVKHTRRGLAFEGVDKTDPKNREHGTDSLVKILKGDTPGQKNEAYYASEIPNSFGNFARGARVRFSSHSLDMGDNEEQEGTVVGTNVQHLRVRADNGMLYKVRHKDATIVEEAIVVSEEFINFDILTENLLDKAVETVRKHVMNGKSVEDVIWDFSVATGFKVPAKELYGHYIKLYGNKVKSSTFSDKDRESLIRKYS